MKKIVSIVILFLTIQNYAQDSIVEPRKNEEVENSAQKSIKKWKFDFTGFIQADVIIDDKKVKYIDGYLPTHIESNAKDYNTYISLRQSQFGLGITNTETGIKGYVEIDLIGDNNKTQPRLRKVYITYKNWKIGQDWSTVDDLNTWPNILDFNGPNSAAFGRRMMIQYSKEINPNNSFKIALEDPAIPSVTLPKDDLWKNKSLYPNLVGVYRYGSHSYVRAAGILSPITVQNRETVDGNYKSNTTLGYGINLTSNIYVNKLSNFKIGAYAGKGVSTRVVAFSGEGYDALVNQNTQNSLKTLPVLSLLGAYEHWWNNKWSSVLFYSYATVGKQEYMTDNMLKSVQHGGFNTMYQPNSHFKTGVDFTYGFVERYGSNKLTEAARLQFSVVYMFR
jgi:hypothetical protein